MEFALPPDKLSVDRHDAAVKWLTGEIEVLLARTRSTGRKPTPLTFPRSGPTR